MKSFISMQLESPAHDNFVNIEELIRLRGEARKRIEGALNRADRAEAAAARVALQQAAAAVSARVNPGERRRQRRTH